MIVAVAGFVDLLRRAGLRVSTAETIDAARALATVGVDEPDTVRAALAATLVKRAVDRALFDDLFALYFRRAAPALPATPDAIRAELAARAATPIERLLAGLPVPELPNLIRAAADEVGLDQAVSPLQAGMFGFRMLDALGLQAALEAAAGDATAGAHADRLRRVVRAYVDDAIRRNEPRLGERLAEVTLADRAIAQLTPAELASLDAELQRLARRLAARLPVPRPDRRRGRLDVRATLRRSLATGGVPFDVRRRKRPVRRPRLVLLCDISDSVRAVSRFFLALVHALARRFDRIHTFVFVADLGDATRLFRSRDVDRAIAEVLAGAIVDPWQGSDYGRALGVLEARHLGKIGSRTTVIVLGDGRSNYRPPRADVLEAVQRRAHRVLWLNPEPSPVWGGDSAMPAYAPHCDRVLTVWNLRSLRAAVDELVAA